MSVLSSHLGTTAVYTVVSLSHEYVCHSLDLLWYLSVKSHIYFFHTCLAHILLESFWDTEFIAVVVNSSFFKIAFSNSLLILC